jgi:hypothetical protein
VQAHNSWLLHQVLERVSQRSGLLVERHTSLPVQTELACKSSTVQQVAKLFARESPVRGSYARMATDAPDRRSILALQGLLRLGERSGNGKYDSLKIIETPLVDCHIHVRMEIKSWQHTHLM